MGILILSRDKFLGFCVGVVGLRERWVGMSFGWVLAGVLTGSFL